MAIMTSTRRLAIVVASLALSGACTSSTAPSSPAGPNTFHAESSDPAGDAASSPGALVAPDLVHAAVDVNAGTVTFAIQFAPGTMNPQSTRVTIELDTDQNPTTGIVVGGPLGIDYVLDMWARASQTIVQRATPVTCASDACYSDAGTATLAVGTDSMTATVALATLGNASGRLNYRVSTYVSPQPMLPTVNSDVMPDITLAPAHVP